MEHLFVFGEVKVRQHTGTSLASCSGHSAWELNTHRRRASGSVLVTDDDVDIDHVPVVIHPATGHPALGVHGVTGVHRALHQNLPTTDERPGAGPRRHPLDTDQSSSDDARREAAVTAERCANCLAELSALLLVIDQELPTPLVRCVSEVTILAQRLRTGR